jgi:hypothetical protein
MNELELIQRAKERISRGWTRRAFARDRLGLKAHPTDSTACAWCLAGALNVTENAQTAVTPAAMRVLRILASEVSPFISTVDDPLFMVTEWNDEVAGTSTKVLELLSKVEGILIKEQSNG